MARICMVAYTYYPTDTRVRREAEALAYRADNVEVISLGQKDKDIIQTLNEVKLIQILSTRYRGSNRVFYLINYFLFFIIASFILTVKHLKKPYQIIQVHTMPDFMVFVAIIPKLLGAKIILDVHDLMPELYQTKFKLPRNHWMIRFITWIERCSIRFANVAIAVHKPHLDLLIKHGNPLNKFRVLLNLPDPNVFSNKGNILLKKNSGFMIIYHGMLAYRNGLHVAIKALSNIKDEIKGLHLLIIGEGDAVPDLVDLVNELELGGIVDIKNCFMQLKDLVPIILEADIGIVPILYDEFTKYMLPVKLLEYVALGIPVICSRTETIKAYFDDSMVLFSTPGDVAELTEKIRLLYKKPEIRDQLIKNSDRFNQGYNWQQQKQLYYRMIDDLLKINSTGEVPA